MYQETEDFRLNDEIIKTIENLAKNLICASLSEINCDECQQDQDILPKSLQQCANCDFIRENVKNFNCGHSCGFSCHKKKRQMTIKSKEGHGYLDQIKEEEEMKVMICRYGYPKPIMRETTFIPAIFPGID